MERKREVGRGERVIPGLWRLRLPLPWPGVPHCNAWAIAAGDGIVLVDTGMHEPGSMDQLERALDQVNLRVDLVRLVVCTHAHSDHLWGISDHNNAALLFPSAEFVASETEVKFWNSPELTANVSPVLKPEVSRANLSWPAPGCA